MRWTLLAASANRIFGGGRRHLPDDAADRTDELFVIGQLLGPPNCITLFLSQENGSRRGEDKRDSGSQNGPHRPHGTAMYRLVLEARTGPLWSFVSDVAYAADDGHQKGRTVGCVRT